MIFHSLSCFNVTNRHNINLLYVMTCFAMKKHDKSSHSQNCYVTHHTHSEVWRIVTIKHSMQWKNPHIRHSKFRTSIILKSIVETRLWFKNTSAIFFVRIWKMKLSSLWFDQEFFMEGRCSEGLLVSCWYDYGTSDNSNLYEIRWNIIALEKSIL